MKEKIQRSPPLHDGLAARYRHVDGPVAIAHTLASKRSGSESIEISEMNNRLRSPEVKDKRPDTDI